MWISVTMPSTVVLANEDVKEKLSFEALFTLSLWYLSPALESFACMAVTRVDIGA